MKCLVPLCILSLMLVLRDVDCLVIFANRLVIIEEQPQQLQQQLEILTNKSIDDKIKLTVFYATQCPFCINFFKKQLPRLFDNETNGGLYKYIDFDLVPFVLDVHKDGDEWVYTCMHGSNECAYSKLHACILNEVSTAKTDNDVQKLIQFLICLMSTSREVDVLARCITSYNVDTVPLRNCLGDNNLVGKLVSDFVKRAKNNNPGVSFVPWIQFNDVFDTNATSIAQEDIIKGVCDHLKCKPEVCQAAAIKQYINNDIIDVSIVE